MKKFNQRISSDSIIDLLVGSPQKQSVWLQRGWLLVLFVGGLLLWGQFLNWGRGPINFHDWVDITAPRLSFLRAAIIRGELPLHLSGQATVGDITRRFLAIPDQILSPQVFLLPWLDVSRFVLLQYWLMYGLGFWALLHLRRRLKLSLLAFTVLFALYNFNGHILAHASVGHATWGGYFLYAAFVLLVFDLLDGNANWRWVVKVVFLSLFIYLQGSYHQFVYMLFFLGLLAISVPRHFWLLLATSVFAVLVAMARILPAALLIGQGANDFVAGFPLAQSFWEAMTQIQVPNDLANQTKLIKLIGNWELTYFVGLPAAAFILYFGVVRTLIEHEDPHHFKVVLLPCLGLTLLSLDAVYKILRIVFPLPLITGERVAARIFSLAFVFILIIASTQFQRWLDKNRPSLVGTLAILLLALLTANDLLRNLYIWSVPRAALHFKAFKFDPALYFPENQYDDRQYLALLIAGLIVSLLSAAALLFLAWQEQRVSSSVHSKS